MSKNDRRHVSGAKLYAHGPPTSMGPRVDDGGGRRDRTDDLLLAKQALSQLSYAPSFAKASEGKPSCLCQGCSSEPRAGMACHPKRPKGAKDGGPGRI